MSVMNIEDTYPLSPMQQAMLFQYQLDPRSGLYIQQVLGSLHEELNVPAFHRAWERVLTRHPVLRTSFRWEETGEPMQDVHSHVSLPFEEQDWRALTAPSQQSRFAAFLKQDRKRGFDLSQAPLLRLALFRTGEADYRFVCTYHHIIADGGARYILLNEVFALYEAYCEGRDLEPERPRPYRDHIDWLRQKGSSDSEPYWRQLLKGFAAPTAVDVVPKTGRSDDGQERYGEQETRLAASVTAHLKSVAGQHHLSLNTFVQGAWAILLGRYAGEEDVVFGAVRGCRRSTVEGAGSIVGLFLNTLPVRVRIPPEQKLVPWLEELREQHIAVRDHEQTPLGHVVRWSDVPRGTPLFESIVVFDYARLNTRLRQQGESWLSRELRVIEDPAFAMVLHAYSEAELLLRMLYDRRRFDDATIERMLGHLKTLLEGMAENLDRPLADLPILTAAERHQLLVEWNDTATDYPKDKCLHELFETQVERTPEAVALVFESEQLTYGDLNRRANQLAHYLQRLGVGPEVLVGVYMERSLEMVIALYGILKAGGAYVPLDPEYPPDRVAFMLEDAQVPVLLTQQRLAEGLPAHAAHVLCLDSEWQTVAQESVDSPVSAATADNLAYVIYTSGSTGRPKGAMNTHRGICNRLLWMQDAYHLTEADRVLQKTPFSFDVSVWEFFWPLLVGARLVVAQPGGHKDSAYLVRTIVDQQITTLHFVPSMLQLFLEDKDVQKCRSLKRVICSGEALPHELQQRFFERLDAELHNLYGPTEAAVDVTYWQCQPQSELKTVPIGRPVANTQLYVLDRHMQPVPTGVAGELYIGGVQVARGYLNRPELTAERFIPDPFRHEPDARLYKTGDLVRYLPDGNIEFLGRLDHQVKLRGFRIELGEIEAVLSLHPAIREAVVLLREDVPDDKRLVAYVVPKQQAPLTIGQLRDYLKEKLPEYMVPAAFVQLEALPLTPNGKVDRRSLPAPTWEGQSEKAYVAPQNELQNIIAGIWRELLQVDRVGLDDSFFDLGGHSLLIMQAHHRLSEVTGRELSMTDMFRFPTIRTLTQYLSQDPGNGDQITIQKSADRAKTRREAMLRQQQHRQKARIEDHG
jgi:amino acid adenylation domain-containing protein